LGEFADHMLNLGDDALAAALGNETITEVECHG
jgi:hypothetical protein